MFLDTLGVRISIKKTPGDLMLKTWTLQHFKSVYDRTRLSMAPLTIFAGVNNSGKSTLIQSILLTAQTIQMPLQERPIALNGHILRLGTFNDIVSSGFESSAIHVGFTLSELQDLEARPRLGQGRFMSVRLWRRLAPSVDELSCEFSFSSRANDRKKELLQLQPNLETCELRVQIRTEKQVTNDGVGIHRRDSLNDFVKLLHLKEVSGQELKALEYEVVKKPSAALPTSALTTGEIVGISLNHFVPRLFLISYDAVEEHARQVVKAFASSPEPWDEELDDDDIKKLPQQFKDIVLEICQPMKSQFSAQVPPVIRTILDESWQELQESFSPTTYRQFLSKLGQADRTVIYQIMAERREQLVAVARQDAPPEYRTRYQPLSQSLNFAADALVSFFQGYVKYLAPLRDEPKPVYPLAGSTDPTDVGFRGEHTAAVLELNRNETVEYIRSSDVAAGIKGDQRFRASLYTAVLDWLGYMGVVSDVSTTDLGKLGHELKVSTSDTKCLRDLTHVGVGVSQVLPIVVLALLADPGSTLIFEQPELHLHPRVQSRLADFFLSMILLGKQCIVETHSEHLINKLRQRVASSDQPDLASKIVMYFVESIDGKSEYRPVEITSSGGIKNWPRGFFDEGEELASEILKAAIAKRGRASTHK